MKANLINGISVDGVTRSKLSNVIPLDTPYTVVICPIYACNFKCTYCLHSLEEKDRPFISSKIAMGWSMYKKIIDEMKQFPNRLKILNFCGIGEPLLYSNIDKMIKYAFDSEVADTLEIVTNGVLLTKEMSDKLIDAGLTRLKISVQGLNSDSYKEFSNVDINFSKFIEQVKYFYENKGKTKLYVKILDVALKDRSEKDFFDIFGNICDDISVENLVPTLKEIDFNKQFKKDFNSTMNGCKLINPKVCPRPFFSMNIYPDGNYVPCCGVGFPTIIGNAEFDSIVDVWNSKKMKDFQRMQLKDNNKNKVCSNCNNYKYVIFKEDYLDDEAEELLCKI